MGRREVEDDDWDDDEPSWEDSESFWDSEDYGDETDDTIPCPYCRREIHEDAERCPYCERYVSDEDAPPTPKPWWFVVGFLLCLYVLFRWLVW